MGVVLPLMLQDECPHVFMLQDECAHVVMLLGGYDIAVKPMC